MISGDLEFTISLHSCTSLGQKLLTLQHKKLTLVRASLLQTLLDKGRGRKICIVALENATDKSML
jgi:hypothetical protein